MAYEKASDVILNECLKIKKNEKVLIVYDKGTKKIGEGILNFAKNISKADSILIPIQKQSGEEPNNDVAKKMLDYDVLVLATTKSLTHTNAVKSTQKKGARVASMPGITDKIMKTSLLADYEKLTELTKKIEKFVKNANHVKITTPSGTDLELSVKGREWIADIGDLWTKGKRGNLPAGEIFVAPLEGTTNGVLMIDDFKHNDEVHAKKGTKVIIKNGEVVECTDKNSLLNSYFEKIKNSKNIAEFGIGTNDKASLIGNILNDEKIFGTCHIAFGNSSSFGGKVYSELHIDTILQKPTLIFDGKVLMKEGKIVL